MIRQILHSARTAVADRRGVSTCEVAMLTAGFCFTMSTLQFSAGPALLTMVASAIFGVPPVETP